MLYIKFNSPKKLFVILGIITAEEISFYGKTSLILPLEE